VLTLPEPRRRHDGNVKNKSTGQMQKTEQTEAKEGNAAF